MRSEEHTSELQSHHDLHSFPTRRSSDLNYHGPLHFYVLLLSQTLLGRNVWALRLPVVLVSVSCVWLALKFEPLIGRSASRIAALAMAVSPGFIFYEIGRAHV